MIIIKSLLLSRFPEISFGFSTKVHLGSEAPFNFNLSQYVGDDPDVVYQNRKMFFNELGIEPDVIAFQKQVHGDEISVIEKSGYCGESDVMITQKPGIPLAISTADCTPIFLFDNKNKIIVGIHSGWKSTAKKITSKTIQLLISDFKVNPIDLNVYIGPSISQKNYEVGEEVAVQFDAKYIKQENQKLFLDVAGCNYDMLLENEISIENIQRSNLCSFEQKDLLHSYRREGLKSGRALGLIYLKQN
ncbi:MAG: peptidoglycan editing factor PgeF [Ignavibacteria bacterium]|nr:peptidoglycan editing factor PgeF [Ignavibacteria bacterium]